MDWYALGHAMWLCRAGSLRILFDPLLQDVHHGGVFEVFPPRAVHAEALRPDFLVVSHRHPDHFDTRSLRALATLDPETVVVTPDALIEEVAYKLGFRTVRRVDSGVRVELDGVRLVTTPAAGSALEWGVLVESKGLTAWNQVDTAQGGADNVRRTLREAGAALGRELVRPDLVLARWQPLKEIDAVLARDIGFPYAEYAAVLDEVAAVDARAVVPSAAGAVHRGAYAFMNRCVHPVPEGRFLRDIRLRCPGATVSSNITGARYRVEPQGVIVEPEGGRRYVTVTADAKDPRVFRPFEIPPVCDVESEVRAATLRETVRRWVKDDLAPALEGRDREPTRRVLEVAYRDGADAFTLVTEGGVVRVIDGFDDDYDVLDVAAGTLLVDVIEGRRHWGDLLLGGMLRASVRACHADAAGLRARRVAPIFLYYAISYEESVRRAVAWELAGGVHPR